MEINVTITGKNDVELLNRKYKIGSEDKIPYITLHDLIDDARENLTEVTPEEVREILADEREF